jgi:hypothetical protein
VEGLTEQTFVKQSLAPQLIPRSVYLTATMIGKPGRKGGIRSYETIRRDILGALRQDQQRYCTTMFDYYGLPSGWPGKVGAEGSPSVLAESVERAMHEDICGEMGESFAPARFIPYIQMHEFEALLFSDPATLASVVQHPFLASSFQAIVNECGEPEAIDDRPDTAPSRRICRQTREYDKVLHGTIAAQRIGVAEMRDRCPHFNRWVERLEELGNAG